MAGMLRQRVARRGPEPAIPLWVGHWPAGVSPPPDAAPAARALQVDTCMRRLLVTGEPQVAARITALHPEEMRAGADAYLLLLEVTTGLRSAVPGETNVFGQFRRAWDGYRRHAEADAVRALGPHVARLIHDTRAVRHAYLQNLGGASYGSLVRRLLAPGEGERVLFVGAGELARSMLPFFRAQPIGVWNRSAPGAAFAAAARLFTPADGAAAAAWAHHVVMTTPADAHNDGCWSAWLSGSLAQSVVHLGHRRGAGWGCPDHLAGYDLDDVFELRRSQDNIRSLQLGRARLDCRRLAAAFAAGAGPGRRQATA